MTEQFVVSLLNRVPAPLARPFRGGGALARATAPLLERALPRRPTEIVVRSGVAAGTRLLIDPQSEKFYWTGAYEQGVQQALARVLYPGAVFWDVGAHLGFFTALASRRVGPLGAVHAFEPVEANRARLAATVELNGLGNVTVHSIAVAGDVGEFVLHQHDSSLMWSLGGADGDGVRVRCETIDDLARRLPAPDVLKIDAEGFELDVLRGASGTLAEGVAAIVVELNGGARERDLAALAPDRRIERLDRDHWLLLREQT